MELGTHLQRALGASALPTTALLVTALLSGACAGGGSGTRSINRGDFNILSLEEEWQLGRRLEETLHDETPVVRDFVAQSYLDRVGRLLVDGTELGDFEWSFQVVADPDIYSFCLPGGRVYLTTGLVAAVDNASELAAALAHVSSHGVARHATEKLSRAYGVNFLGNLALGQKREIYEEVLTRLASGGSLGRYTTVEENEADQLGLRAMIHAGFDPEAMGTFFSMILERCSRGAPETARFCAAHPVSEERLAVIDGILATLPAGPARVLDEPGFHRLQDRLARVSPLPR